MSSRTPGLFQRGAKYWLRIVAPTDLKAAFYGGKKFAFEGTLGTSDPAVAKVAAIAKRAEMEATFLQQRRQLAPPKLSLRRTISRWTCAIFNTSRSLPSLSIWGGHLIACTGHSRRSRAASVGWRTPAALCCSSAPVAA